MALSVVLSFMLAPLSSATAQEPPGNNGFIKIDGELFDDLGNNEPHVGCTFELEFYNYEEGDLDAEVSFVGIPPTGGGTLLTDTVFIGEDPASGGDDLDAAETYTLDFGDLEPHPEQGYHVRLTVHAEGSQGADTKHKVFWVECFQPTSPPPTSPPPTSPPPTSPPPTSPGGTTSVPPPSGGVDTGGGPASTAAAPTIVGLLLLGIAYGLWRLRSTVR